MIKILIVDDELSMREFFTIMLSGEGYQVTSAENGPAAVLLLQKDFFDLVITDIRMPGGMNGIELLERVKELSPQTMVIMISAYATAETAVAAMKQGAYDYIPKPFNVEEVKLIIKKAMDNRNLWEENDRLKRELDRHFRHSRLVGNSLPMIKLYGLIRKVARTCSNVLICGESGTGKELVAHAIHEESPRREKRFVAINCGGLPESLIESELFGHRKGAFTGALSDQKGLFLAADGGTLFLDETGELPAALQVKLLRVIQEKVLRPVGSTEDVNVDVRILSATNKDLHGAVLEGSFREDLFYRLNVIRIVVPPLRDRKEDLPLLVHHFMEKYANGLPDKIRISADAMARLAQYDFPGNVRELQNIIERSVALGSSNTIQAEDLFFPERDTRRATADRAIKDIPRDFDLEAYISNTEREILLKALEVSRGAKQKAAGLLGITFRSFRHRLSKYGL